MSATKSAAPAAPAVPAPPKTASDLLNVKRRDPAYRLDKDGKRAYTGEQSFCTRGINIKSNVASLVHVNGESQTALPLAVVAHAIKDGVITREEIAYLHRLADESK